MSTDVLDTCAVCHTPLGYCKTIFAVKGLLYCSEKCGRKESEYFEDLAEELTPSSIGIMPHRDYKITGVDYKGRRLKPKYTNFPGHFNIYRGTVWHVLPDGKLKKAYDVVN